ncbi:MAG TPA: hypothetical protein PKN54_08110, partial [Candidatus Cloacimonas acidaminovorans]|nr:hypothetical protein [Candidatus Cloacimonas acidaminovorans]
FKKKLMGTSTLQFRSFGLLAEGKERRAKGLLAIFKKKLMGTSTFRFRSFGLLAEGKERRAKGF